MEKDVEYIIVGGEKIKCEIKNLDIFELRYYPDNPRVNSIISKYPQEQITQEVIEKGLWDLNPTKDLFQDIKRNRGLIEEIIVRGNEVLEGNSRLCAYRKLYEYEKSNEEKEYWRYIRAKILPNDVKEEKVFIVLGKLHIKGKTPWRTYEQAAYIYKMTKIYGRTPEEISEMIGISENDVRDMIQSYETMRNGDVNDVEKFSYFYEFFKNAKLEKIRKETPQITSDFTSWVKENRIPRAERVRDLPTILNDKKAKKVFVNNNEDFETALDIAQERNPEATSSFYRTIKKTTRVLRNAKVEKIKEEIEIDSTRKNYIKYLAREIKKFCRNLGIEF